VIVGIVLVHVDIIVIAIAIERITGFMMGLFRSVATVATVSQALVCLSHPDCSG